MRADAHYVDLLEAPRPGWNGADADDDRAWSEAMVTAASAAGASELARSLSALTGCATLLGNAVSAFTHAVAADLLRAELWRATCLLQSVRVLRAEVPVYRRSVAVQSLVARVLESIEPERRLRGSTLNRQLTLSHGRIHADEELLVCALSGVLVATLALVDGMNAQLTVLARVDPGGDFTFSVTLDSLTIPAAWLTLPREEPSGHGAGGIGGIVVPAARRIVETCGGRMALIPSGRGNGIQVMIPTLP